ncbi:MAG: hypothetical protein WC867_01825 [Candidatus Pacearchaeota archaeon]|jgi:hypothetical protein
MEIISYLAGLFTILAILSLHTHMFFLTPIFFIITFFLWIAGKESAIIISSLLLFIGFFEIMSLGRIGLGSIFLTIAAASYLFS